jgi:hypothetical protein
MRCQVCRWRNARFDYSAENPLEHLALWGHDYSSSQYGTMLTLSDRRSTLFTYKIARVVISMENDWKRVFAFDK